MKYHELFYRNEQYFVSGESLKEAKKKFADEHVCLESEIESAFQHNYPVKFLKWCIGIYILGLAILAAYLIFLGGNNER